MTKVERLLGVGMMTLFRARVKAPSPGWLLDSRMCRACTLQMFSLRIPAIVNSQIAPW
jgi:hypothetical protein